MGNETLNPKTPSPSFEKFIGKRRSRLGVFVDPEMWTNEDWRDLLKALTAIQKRHKKRHETNPKNIIL